MYRIYSLYCTIIQFPLLIGSTTPLSLNLKKASAQKSIVKNPLLNNVRQKIKKVFSIFHSHEAKDIKKPVIRFGTEKLKFLEDGSTYGPRPMKYIGDIGLKKHVDPKPQKLTQQQQISRKVKKNREMRTAWHKSEKELRSLVKRTAELMHGQELRTMVNIISKKKSQIPFLIGGGLLELTEFKSLPKYIFNKELGKPELPTDLSEKPVPEIDKFGRALPHKTGEYYNPLLCVDSVLFHNAQILLITRGNDPCKGSLALPGGYVDYNTEPQYNCIKEQKEECNVDSEVMDLIGVFGNPQRDPIKHTVSAAYLVKPKVLNDKGGVDFKAGDDAASAAFFNVKDILKKDSPHKLAFDHYQIIKKGWELYKKLKK